MDGSRMEGMLGGFGGFEARPSPPIGCAPIYSTPRFRGLARVFSISPRKRGRDIRGLRAHNTVPPTMLAAPDRSLPNACGMNQNANPNA